MGKFDSFKVVEMVPVAVEVMVMVMVVLQLLMLLVVVVAVVLVSVVTPLHKQRPQPTNKKDRKQIMVGFGACAPNTTKQLLRLSLTQQN